MADDQDSFLKAAGTLPRDFLENQETYVNGYVDIAIHAQGAAYRDFLAQAAKVVPNLDEQIDGIVSQFEGTDDLDAEAQLESTRRIINAQREAVHEAADIDAVRSAAILYEHRYNQHQAELDKQRQDARREVMDKLVYGEIAAIGLKEADGLASGGHFVIPPLFWTFLQLDFDTAAAKGGGRTYHGVLLFDRDDLDEEDNKVLDIENEAEERAFLTLKDQGSVSASEQSPARLARRSKPGPKSKEPMLKDMMLFHAHEGDLLPRWSYNDDSEDKSKFRDPGKYESHFLEAKFTSIFPGVRGAAQATIRTTLYTLYERHRSRYRAVIEALKGLENRDRGVSSRNSEAVAREILEYDDVTIFTNELGLDPLSPMAVQRIIKRPDQDDFLKKLRPAN